MTFFAKQLWILAILTVASVAAPAVAATLSFSVPEGTVVREGREFPVDIMLDPEGETANAFELSVRVPASLRFSGSGQVSALPILWVERPVYDAVSGSVRLSGAIPGGFSGLIDPFHPGERLPVTAARLYFMPVSTGAVALTGRDALAYKADGLGTEIPTRIQDLFLTVLPGVGQGGGAIIDTEPPLPFSISIVSDPLLYEGKRVLVFSATDAGSGVDYYEIREGSGEWTRAESPYLLFRQRGGRDVFVKAVDRAGNERVESVFVPGMGLPRAALAGALGILCAIIVATRSVWKRTHSRRAE